MATNLSNSEVLEILGLPKTIVDKLKSDEATTYKAAMNEFLPKLMNKIVYQMIYSFDFSNPFKKYDSYPIDYGDTGENVFVDLVNGYEYGTDGNDPFKEHKPNVYVSYVSLNYKMQYCVSVNRPIIRQACLGTYGFSKLARDIAHSIVTKREVDEYTAQIIALNNPAVYKKGIEELDISTLTTDAEKMKKVTKTIGLTLSDMKLPSVSNNKAGVLTGTPFANTLVIIKNELKQNINFDYLAGVFNLDKVAIASKFIEVRSFKTVVNDYSGASVASSEKGDDIAFVILDDRGFDNHVALEDNDSIYNPKSKTINYFTDLWKAFGFNPTFQARAFKLKESA